MTNQTPDSTKPSEREELIALARRCLWIAYCWNDHNFEPANTYARTEAEKLGIQSFEHANEWLDKAALLAEDKQVKVEQSERPYVDRGDAVNLARNVLEVERDKPLAVTSYGFKLLCEAVLRMDAALLAADGSYKKGFADCLDSIKKLGVPVDAGSCAECAKKSADGWAFYCLECLQKNGVLAADDKAVGEVVLYQYRWLNPTNKHCEPASMLDWKLVELRNPYTDTIEGQVRELEAYRYQGMPVYEVRALFTRPQQAAQVAQPLTDEQITKQFIHTEETENQFVNFERGVRFAEAAHGIGKDQAS